MEAASGGYYEVGKVLINKVNKLVQYMSQICCMIVHLPATVMVVQFCQFPLSSFAPYVCVSYL